MLGIGRNRQLIEGISDRRWKNRPSLHRGGRSVLRRDRVRLRLCIPEDRMDMAGCRVGMEECRADMAADIRQGGAEAIRRE